MSISADTGESDVRSGSGRGLIAFLDWTIASGQLVGATGTALRTGVRKVLETRPELFEADVRAIDVDDEVRLFRNRARGSAKDKTIDQYEQRFRQSTEMYRRWLADDRDWLPARSRARSRSTASKTPGPMPATSGSPAARDASEGVGPVEPPPAHTGMVTYPLPLRPGVKATLVLPENLATAEAHRIAAFVAAIAFDAPGGDVAAEGDAAIH